jgi:methylglyoxal/glyoxal reductase
MAAKSVLNVCRNAMSIESTKSLLDGNFIPRFGLGVYQAANDGETEAAVYAALKAGYRHVDTAEIYRNEQDVGKAIKRFLSESGLPRESLYVTTKYMPARGVAADEALTHERVNEAMRKSLEALQLDYVDLYLIHSPHNKENRLFEWDAMSGLKDSGKARSIGISNYGIAHMQELLATNPKHKPTVNQLELNPYITRAEIVSFCNEQSIAVEAYSPLTKAQKLEDPKLVAIATKYSVTTAQLMIRWCLQRDMVVIPKSVTESRIIENALVWDMEITKEDMAVLDSFDEYLVTGWDPTTGP